MLAMDGTLAQAGLAIEIQETIHAMDFMHAVTRAVSFRLQIIGIFVMSSYNLTLSIVANVDYDSWSVYLSLFCIFFHDIQI